MSEQSQERKTSPDEVHLRRLSWFVTRARRVEEHSLAAETGRLADWAGGKATLRFSEGGGADITWDLPPEEALDSLAARCRPFVLNNDTVFYAKVMNSLGYFLQNDAELSALAKEFGKSWRKLDRSSPDLLAFASRAGSLGGELGELVGDKELAYAWLYGDLVHADEIPERLGSHDIDSRFQGGALLVCNIAMHVIATLNLLRKAVGRKLIDLPDELFSRRVIAETKSNLTIDRMVSAPVGTSPQDLEKILDSTPGSVATMADGEEP